MTSRSCRCPQRSHRKTSSGKRGCSRESDSAPTKSFASGMGASERALPSFVAPQRRQVPRRRQIASVVDTLLIDRCDAHDVGLVDRLRAGVAAQDEERRLLWKYHRVIDHRRREEKLSLPNHDLLRLTVAAVLPVPVFDRARKDI